MIDLTEFRSLLAEAITKHFSKMKEELDGFYGYSLYTEDGLSSVGGVCNSENDISVDSSDGMYNYYRYGAIEWQHFDDFGLFDELNAKLSVIMDCADDIWAETKQNVLDACLEVLQSLDSFGLFGTKDSGRFVVICLSDSDNPIMDKSAAALNSKVVYEAYAREFVC